MQLRLRSYKYTWPLIYRKGSTPVIRLVYTYIIILCLTSGALSCRKLVEVDAPENQISGENIYDDNGTAASVMSGLYSELSNAGIGGGLQGLSLRAGLLSDELKLWGSSSDQDLNQYYKNGLTSNNGTYWNELYNNILTVNKAIEGYSSSASLLPSVKMQLTGEAKFMRAFFYFYLVNLYGDVPLITSSDYNANKSLGRTTVADVYKQIIADLVEARALLSEDYLSGTVTVVVPDRVRPTKWAAIALLARVYLYNGNWDKAMEYANLLINNTRFVLTGSLNDVFLANSSEAIWQIQPTNPSWNTLDAQAFIIQNGPGIANPVYLTQSLVSSFEANDQRASDWIGVNSSTGTNYYYPYKYKNLSGRPWTENIMVFRLSEQYLLRAEAKVEIGDLDGAKGDLDRIRNRAGLPNTSASSKETLLNAILKERRSEFFSEWGHRWFDLKRTGTIDAAMTAASVEKQTVWKADWKLLPIPIADITKDPKIIQNAGY